MANEKSAAERRHADGTLQDSLTHRLSITCDTYAASPQSRSGALAVASPNIARIVIGTDDVVRGIHQLGG